MNTNKDSKKLGDVINESQAMLDALKGVKNKSQRTKEIINLGDECLAELQVSYYELVVKASTLHKALDCATSDNET